MVYIRYIISQLGQVVRWSGGLLSPYATLAAHVVARLLDMLSVMRSGLISGFPLHLKWKLFSEFEPNSTQQNPQEFHECVPA